MLAAAQCALAALLWSAPLGWVIGFGPLFLSYLWALGLGDRSKVFPGAAMFLAVGASLIGGGLFTWMQGLAWVATLPYFAVGGAAGVTFARIRVTPGARNKTQNALDYSKANAHKYVQEREGKADVITAVGMDPYAGVLGGTQGAAPLGDPWEEADGSEHHLQVDDG